MFICSNCHTARQARAAQEHQPLQYVEPDSEFRHKMSCPDCGLSVTSERFQYLTAHELNQELTEAREELARLERTRADFPVQGYHSAADMLDRSRIFPSILADTEAFAQALQYAADIEEVE